MKTRKALYTFLLLYLGFFTSYHALPVLTGNPGAFDTLFREKFMAMFPTLFVHTISAIIMLLIGPLMFLSGRFKLSQKWHRRLGGLYFLCLLFAAPTGLFLSLYAFGGIVNVLGFGLMSGLWIVTGVFAIGALIRRDFKEHAAWMTRNVALTYAAVTFRIILHGSMRLGVEFEEVYSFAVWGSLLLNMGVSEGVILMRHYRGKKEKIRVSLLARADNPYTS